MTGSRRGMTLVELMVALVIAGLMTATGSLAFTQIIAHRNTIQTASEGAERGAALHEMLHGWLYSGTVTITATGPTRGASSTAQVTAADGMLSVNPAVVSGDVLTFTTTALTPTQSATTSMRLFIDDDNNTPEYGLTLEYRVSAQTHLMRVQLDTTIVQMDVEYRNTATNEWVPASEATGITPKAARVTFHSSDSLNTSGIVSIPIVLPMGANPTAEAGQAGAAGGAT